MWILFGLWEMLTNEPKRLYREVCSSIVVVTPNSLLGIQAAKCQRRRGSFKHSIWTCCCRLCYRVRESTDFPYKQVERKLHNTRLHEYWIPFIQICLQVLLYLKPSFWRSDLHGWPFAIAYVTFYILAELKLLNFSPHAYTSKLSRSLIV